MAGSPSDLHRDRALMMCNARRDKLAFTTALSSPIPSRVIAQGLIPILGLFWRSITESKQRILAVGVTTTIASFTFTPSV